MEGILDDEPLNNPTAGTQATAQQPGPFADLVSQFQYNRSSGAGAGYGGAYGAPAQQQPVMDWGQGFQAAQQAALTNMTGAYGAGAMDPTAAAAAVAGGDMDADGGYAKRQRMEESAMMAMPGAPHTSSSTNQLQALAQQGAGWGQQQAVEGTDLTAVYEQARAQQYQQHQQQHHHQQQQQQQAAMYGYGAGLMDSGYTEAPINSLGPSDLQQQMLLQQQQQQHALQPGQYNLSQPGTGGRTRLDRLGGGTYSSRVPVPAAQAQGPSRLTTGHKHAEYLQNLVRARFHNTPNQGGSGIVTRSAATAAVHQHQQQHTMQEQYGYYSQYGVPGQEEEDNADEDADQVLSKCEAVSQQRLGAGVGMGAATCCAPCPVL
jgi:hypothetical protein